MSSADGKSPPELSPALMQCICDMYEVTKLMFNTVTTARPNILTSSSPTYSSNNIYPTFTTTYSNTFIATVII